MTAADADRSATGAVYRRLAVNSAYLVGGTVVTALCLMLAAVLNARALSPHSFGVLVLFQSATLTLTTLMSFATQQPVIKLGSTALAKGDVVQLGRIISLALLTDAVAAITTSAVAFACLYLAWARVGLTDDLRSAAGLFALSLLFTGFLSATGIFRLFNRFGLLSAIQAACAALLMAVTAYLYATAAPFQAYCWTWAIYYALNSQVPLFVGLYLVRRAGIPLRWATGSLPAADRKTFIAYCSTTWGTSTIEGLRLNGDSLLVGALVSVPAAGVYNVAKQLAGVVRKLNNVYASAAFPEISNLSAHRNHAGARRVRAKLLWVGLGIGSLAVLIALLAGRPMLELLFGPAFVPAWIPLVILIAAAAAQMITHTLSMYVQVYVGPGALLRAYMLAILPFILAVVPLTYAFSMIGTATAQILFSLALALACFRALRRADAA